MSVKFEGFKEFIDWADLLDEKIEEQVHKSLLKSAYKVESKAKSLTPVDTGRLRSSITTDDNSTEGSIEIEIGTDVEYAPYVEYGTTKQAEQPFLNPALNSEIPKILTEVSSAIQRGAK